MSITLGIYDVFSYAIPGILYLFTFNEAMKLFGLPFIDITKLNSLSFLILLGLLSYLIGHLFDYISHYAWYRRFYPTETVDQAYDKFVKFSKLEPDFQACQWPMLLSAIRHNNIDVCDAVDKNKAISIMLRNVSFALFLLTSVFAISAFVPKFSLQYLLGAIATLLGSVVALLRSNVFNEWFYRLIFQQSLVFGTNLQDVLEFGRPKTTDSETSSNKQ